MGRSLILLSAFSVFPRSTQDVVSLAYKHRFGGVEIFLHPFARRTLEADVERATALGMEVTLHQFWSGRDNPSIANRALALLGQTLPDAYTLRDQLPHTCRAPVVIYADRAAEATLHHPQYECWWQTYSAFINGKYRVSFEELVELVDTHKRPIVFDTQHVLEHALNVRGVGQLPTDSTVLLRYLEDAWEALGPYVKEIHFNDCIPQLGNLWGRNVFPGEGILPLRTFCRIVNDSGWKGNIVPEVSPLSLMRSPHLKLRMLRETVEDYWDL